MTMTTGEDFLITQRKHDLMMMMRIVYLAIMFPSFILIFDLFSAVCLGHSILTSNDITYLICLVLVFLFLCICLIVMKVKEINVKTPGGGALELKAK